MRSFGLLILITLITIVAIPFQGCEKENDELGQDTCDNFCDTCLVVYKPNIYIHPEENIHLRVDLFFPIGGGIITSIPEYGDGWDIVVDTAGLINNYYSYLFYESKQPNIWQDHAGWIIKQTDLLMFFKNNMSGYGFNSQEIKDFTEYWIPWLNNFAYYYIYPQTKEIIDHAIQLSFSEEPDNILRLFYLVKGSVNPPDQELIEPEIPSFNREGFSVTEWGVILE
jgi:hypothetical protein